MSYDKEFSDRELSSMLFEGQTPREPALSWSSITAGAVVALGIEILITLFFAGSGLFSLFPRFRSVPANVPLPTSAGLAWATSALLSLWLGGWIAGRSARARNARLGGAHGLIVWSLAAIFVVALFFADQAVTARMQPNVALSPLEIYSAKHSDLIAEFVEEACSIMPATDPAESIRARREIGWALFRLISPDAAKSTEARPEAVQVVADFTRRSTTETEGMVNSWVASYAKIRGDLDAARAAAAQVRRQIAGWVFVAAAVGALSAIWGGRAGANAAWNISQEALAASVNEIE